MSSALCFLHPQDQVAGVSSSFCGGHLDLFTIRRLQCVGALALGELVALHGPRANTKYSDAFFFR